jgi:outer membrane protein TolC
MVKFVPLIILIFSFSGWSQQKPGARGPTVSLTQKNAAEMVLKQGLKAKEVNYTYQVMALAPFEALKPYDWVLSLESGTSQDDNQSFSVIDSQVHRRETVFAASKSFLTGTKMTFGYSRTSQMVLQPPATNPATLDVASFTLEQALWGNFLGLADRAAVNAAEIQYNANMILRVNELEDLVLQTLKQFWDTYVAQESFQEALSAKDRYEKLVATVRRKSSTGYSSPGELSRVQAEFETRVQTVKQTSIDYLSNLENLVTLLGLSAATEINFVVPTSLPAVPQLKNIPIEDRRTIRSQKMKVEAAHEAMRAADSLTHPSFNLVGRWGATGLDTDAGEAFSQVSSQANPLFYVGVKFQYSFGSDVQAQTAFNRRMTYELEQTKLKRQLLEESDKELQAERKVAATYAIAQSTRSQKDFREKAVQELTRSYNQGRTDISILIDAMNNYYTSEVDYARAIGDYQIALNEWAAVRDELIPGKEEK